MRDELKIDHVELMNYEGLWLCLLSAITSCVC